MNKRISKNYTNNNNNSSSSSSRGTKRQTLMTIFLLVSTILQNIYTIITKGDYFIIINHSNSIFGNSRTIKYICA